jgi:hypothetical protein
MSDEQTPESPQESPPESPPEKQPEPDKGSSNQLAGYPQYFLSLFTRPDEMLDDKYRGYKIFGLINMGALIALLILSHLIQRVLRTTTSGVRFSWLLDAVKYGLGYAIPIAIVLFLFHWYAKQKSQKFSLDFFMEKFGSMLALPVVLVVTGILFNILTINIHVWFRSAGLIFLYTAVFMASFLYVAPRKFQVAVVFTLGFYLACRLLIRLM